LIKIKEKLRHPRAHTTASRGYFSRGRGPAKCNPAVETRLVRIGNLAVNILYGQKNFRFQKKKFRIFQKSLDISKIEISFPSVYPRVKLIM